MMLSQTVRSIREEQGYSQERVAELSNLNRTYYGNFERGDNISVLKLEQVAQALGLKLSELFTRSGL